ncbi:MAG: XRE family transcriptional regulator [uncultured bacterium]|nr:MAG: XRE family transcriptional regulator [uncultured bacterium]HBR71622.1 hypothetical protein [Candidatus Moranbacteria bacterium]
MVRFTTKKIDSMTLGERMKKLRDDRRLSLNEVSKHTRVQSKYLEYLEKGLYSKLPPEVYVKGFLRNYATFMGINEGVLLKQYEREKKIQQNINKNEKNEGKQKPINFSSFVVTPRIMAVLVGFLLLIGGFFYLYSEVNSFISTPRLVILKPASGVTIDGRNVRVSGVAEKNSKIFINEQPIVVNEKGEFSEDVGLQEGLNTITVKAKNKFDKETSQTINVNANYQKNVQTETVENINLEKEESNGEFELELFIGITPTWVSVETDGNLMYSGVLVPQAAQKFKAKEKISITSGKGNDTYIKLDGKEKEILSAEPGVVRDIVFTPNGRAL